MSTGRLLLLGLTTFAVALIASLPAAWLLTSTPALRLYGVEGTLASGHIRGVTAGPNPLLENLNWNFSPLQLLLLRLGYTVSADVAGSHGESLGARVSRSPLGYWRIRDFKGELNLLSLAGMAGQSYLPLEGRAQLDFDDIGWKTDQPLQAHGTLRLLNLRWTLAQTPLPLGDFEAVFEPNGDVLEAKISGHSGALEVQGEATSKPDHSYELHLQLRPRPGADPALQNLLRTLGPPDSQAWYHLRRSGSF